MGVFAHWPNRITALRFLGAIVLFGILTAHGTSTTVDRTWIQVAFWVFIGVAATDFLDGFLARRYGLVTAFGRIADPFVDKVLVLGAMVYLTVMPWSQGYWPAWVVVVVLAREFLVTAIRGYAESMGVEFPADWFGKVKMIVQCVAVGTVLGLHAFPWPEILHASLVEVAHVTVWATLATTLGSCATYLLKSKHLLLEASR